MRGMFKKKKEERKQKEGREEGREREKYSDIQQNPQKKIKIKNEQNQCLFFHRKDKIVF